MMPRSYSTPFAFKTAVEQRLRNEASASGMDLHRRRQLFVFDRYLARLFHVLEDAVVLKGGLVIELRLQRARTTKDIDLRYRAEAQLAAKIYGAPFGIDVAFAEPMHGLPDEVEGSNFLDFAGVEPGRFRICPLETHVAEKLHAYTLPRKRPNSRVKDLPDIALLATVRDIDGAALRAAIARTFEHRGTHPVPASVPEPPTTWTPVYARIAANDGLRWRTLEEITKAVRSFLDPVLAGTPASWGAEGLVRGAGG